MKNIIQQIDEHGETRGAVPCFVTTRGSYTYADLKKDSDKIAWFLQEKNFTKGPVLVFGSNDEKALQTFIGCVKAGHCYIPVDVHTPIERLRTIIEISEPVAIISTVAWDLSEVSAFLLQDILAEGKVGVTSEQYVSGDENFYIIYTSGTTGVPKGVQVSHDNLLSFVNWMNDDFEIVKNSRTLSQSPFSFDLSIMSLYPTLVAGNTLVGLSREETVNYKVLFETLPTLGLNTWVSTPSFVDICLMDKNFNGENFPDLQTFLFCGEELTNRTAKSLKERFPNTKVWNTYGPTEATVAISFIEMTDKVLSDYSRLPIGVAKPESDIFILDKAGNQLAPNETGEIILTGKSVSKGYYNNPEKTKEAFFTLNGVPAYRTGDAGYLNEQNLLFYTGRMDFQVKLNGYRIEIQDIESHLNTISYVKKAVVLPEIKDLKVKRLVAVVLPNEHAFEKEFQLTKAINEALRALIMDYMIPGKYVYVQDFPLTQNGKVDRKQLEAGVCKCI